jgi:hypothetical protein
VSLGDWAIIGALAVLAVLLVVATWAGLSARKAAEAAQKETGQLRTETINRPQLDAVVNEAVADAVEQVLHAYGLDQTALATRPRQPALPAAPHGGYPDGSREASSQSGYVGSYHGQSGELPVVRQRVVGGQDHPGARAQLADRMGQPPYTPPAEPPPSLVGFEEVTARPNDYIADPGGNDGHWSHWTTPANKPRRPVDTDVIPAVADDGGTPPKFRTSEFMRREGESEKAYAQRKEALTREYEAWLTQQKLEITGNIYLPAIEASPADATPGQDMVVARGAGASAM